jgi:adenine-specific DNA-methyltransferase
MAKGGKKATEPKQVEAFLHDDKRANIPTADAQEFLDPTLEALPPLRYPRDSSLDPQLVWKGKDEQDGDDLIVDAPPIYIQEKIDPRVIIENIRKTSKSGVEPELTLFDSFDGLNELDVVDFYKHDANWSNRMILGDSLQVMASLAERESLRGKVQMIYIDPPYGIKFGSNWQMRASKRDVKDGNMDDATFEAEQIRAFRDTWELGIHSYLSYLRDRLIAARELLTDSGSCFVQIGDENVHLVRSLMDEVFGSDNWVTTICFTKTTSSTNDSIGGTADYILWFSKQRTQLKFRRLYQRKGRAEGGAGSYTKVRLPSGERRSMTETERKGQGDLPAGTRLYTTSDLTSQSMGREKGEGAASWFAVLIDGKSYTPSMQSRWKTSEAGMERLLLAGRVEVVGNTPRYVRYLDDFPAYTFGEVWTDLGGATDKVYVVQTGASVIERCILMSSDPGDLILDPTCGSGTTAAVAEQWGRRWITVDTSRVALAISRQRLMGAKYAYHLLLDSKEGRRKEMELAGSPLAEALTANDLRRGFVYERVQHVTLKSIANNPDIRSDCSQADIDTAIGRHAGSELLYDRPIEDRSKVRITGPFTVESLSPHRSLAFAAKSSHLIVEPSVTVDSFESIVLENLRKSGIQNGRKQERLSFDAVEPHAGLSIQALGIRLEAADGSPKRVAVVLGPQYGTVSPGLIKTATREAMKIEGVDLVAVLGFAFDPTVLNTVEGAMVSTDGFADVVQERSLGRMPVLLVRMNADLLMGQELKKTNAANLFTVFGEPDVELRRDTVGNVVVEIKGIDVYDPTTGEIRSSDTSLIALWMIDTDYNDESFFVRHCYFTGGHDPYQRLKRALKAEIDEDAWAGLYKTTSQPFDAPSTGKIAVKVINDYGDEVMKVFEVPAAV